MKRVSDSGIRLFTAGLVLIGVTACNSGKKVEPQHDLGGKMGSKPIILVNSVYRPGERPVYSLPSTYYHAVTDNGGIPLMAPSRGDDATLRELESLCDGFLFIGGADYPPEYYGEEMEEHMEVMPVPRAETDMALAKIALQSGKPILGICAGEQLLNIADGGKLIRHILSDQEHRNEAYHNVAIKSGTLLHDLLKKDSTLVNSSHHQAVDPSFVGSRFVVSALADDGIIEAMETRDDQWILALQWHPERIKDEEMRKTLFSAFIREAASQED